MASIASKFEKAESCMVSSRPYFTAPLKDSEMCRRERWMSWHSFMSLAFSRCKTKISKARACPLSCIRPLQNSAVVIRPSPSSRISKSGWQSRTLTSRDVKKPCTLGRLIAAANSSLVRLPSPSSSAARKSSSSLFWASRAIRRLSSMTMSASLAALAKVSLRNRAVTILMQNMTGKDSNTGPGPKANCRYYDRRNSPDSSGTDPCSRGSLSRQTPPR